MALRDRRARGCDGRARGKLERVTFATHAFAEHREIKDLDLQRLPAYARWAKVATLAHTYAHVDLFTGKVK